MGWQALFELAKFVFPAGATGFLTWYVTQRKERKTYLTHLYALYAEVAQNRDLLREYVMDTRARYYYLTAVARDKPDHLLLGDMREVIPDDLLPALQTYSSQGNRQWFYRAACLAPTGSHGRARSPRDGGASPARRHSA